MYCPNFSCIKFFLSLMLVNCFWQIFRKIYYFSQCFPVYLHHFHRLYLQFRSLYYSNPPIWPMELNFLKGSSIQTVYSIKLKFGMYIIRQHRTSLIDFGKCRKNEESINLSTPLIFKKKNFSLNFFALVIILTSNNSQSNVRNKLKICIQAIWEMNCAISWLNLRVYIEKIRFR